MPTGQSSDECDDTARISQLEHDIGKALEDKDTDRLLDLLFVVKNMNMTPRILKSSSIARLIQKVKKYHATAVSACASELVKNWKDIFKRSIGAEDRQPLVEYAKMSLDDFLEADIHVSPLKDRQYVSQQSCMSSRVRPMQGGVPSSSSSSSSSPSRSTSPNRNPTGRVVYWMSRDQRLCDNWALLKAQEVALQASAPLAIVFSLVGDYPGANMRSYGFMLRNIKLLQSHAEHYNIPFFLLKGSPEVTIPEFCLANNVHTLVADFSPLRQSQQWKNQIAARLSITGVTCLEVDAHNICPCWKVSNKCEFSAKTIRGKIHGLLEEYLHEYPPLREHPDYYSPTLATGARPSTLGQMTDITSSSSSSTTSCTDIDGYNNASGVLQWIANGNAYQSAEGNRDIWTGHFTLLRDVDRSVPEVTWLEAGERASMLALSSFLYNDDSGGSTRGNVRGSRLEAYGTRRNNPCLENGVSHLSAYLHFGQISAQRICLEIKRSRQFSSIRPAMFPDGERTTGVHCFCEELVVRRELSDNFCLYNSHYDTIDGAHNWARTTLEQHWTDVRPVVYAQEELEGAQTSDDLWNAAQLELVHRGKMHGFMRMYWAKKILEWTENPSEAVRIAIYLNDKYSLDGRDPNGYVGCMWAIAGVHDRAWGPERQVFGKIRYMNYDGCKRKFAVKEYIAKQSEWTLSSAENGD